MSRWIATAVLLALGVFRASAIEFKQGDRVALIGNTFLERTQNYGYLETLLTLELADKAVTFRNLAWSGDTVFGHARSYFGPPQEGFDRLKAHLTELKPTLILLNYGAVASFDGPAGLDTFVGGYRRLIAMCRETTGARIALLTPVPRDRGADPYNANLEFYAKAIKELAAADDCEIVDLFIALGGGKADLELFNGIHFSDAGYRGIAPLIAGALGMETSKSPDWSKLEPLRQKIVAKNELFFHRFRPQNETYLFGFRKHEQGNNAAEVPQFDPLIREAEAEISQLAKAIVKGGAR